MTREEERQQAAEDYCNNLIREATFGQFVAHIAGSKWADEHPKQIEISFEDIEELAKEVIPDDWVKRQDTLWEMIRRNQRAQFIVKASEWLDCYIDNYLFIDAENKAGIKWDDFINDFRKVMKGE